MTEQTVLNDNNLFSESDENKIEFFQRQTNYNYSMAKNKLVENKFDEDYIQTLGVNFINP